MRHKDVIRDLKTMARLRSDDRLSALAERGRVRALKVGLVGVIVTCGLVCLPLAAMGMWLWPRLESEVLMGGLLVANVLTWWWRDRVIDEDVLVAMSREAGEAGLAICCKCGYIMDVPGAARCPECGGAFLGPRREGGA